MASIAQLFHGDTNDEKMQEFLMWLSVGCRFSQMLLARLLEVFRISQKLLVMVKTLFFTLAHIFMFNSVIFQPIFYVLAVLERRKIELLKQINMTKELTYMWWTVLNKIRWFILNKTRWFIFFFQILLMWWIVLK